MYDREKIINFDFQGWPECKMSWRDIFNALGIEIRQNEGTDYYKIYVNNPLLDTYPVTLEDDGMGYGVNPKYIIDVSANEKKNPADWNLFLEAPLSKDELNDKLNPKL